MKSAAECRAKSAEALANAGVAHEPLRRHFEDLARDWGVLAVSAHTQEVMEAGVTARQDAAGPPKEPPRRR